MSFRLPAVLALVVCLLAHSTVSSQECVDVKGALLVKKDAGWQGLAVGSKVPYDRTVVSLFSSDIRSANGAVDVRLRGDIGEHDPLPSFEAVVKLHDNPKVDADVSLERGIVVFLNNKKDGPAHVDVRIRGEVVNVTLKEPGTRFGIDLYARHAPGLHGLKADDPAYFIFALTLAGAVDVSYNGKTIPLHAPPGPAILKWDSQLQQAHVDNLDKLPEWASHPVERVKLLERMNQIAKGLAADDSQFQKLLFSEDPLERKVGFTALGALGTPKSLIVAMHKSTHPDTRQFAVGMMRNWLGQAPGQIKKLQDAALELGATKAGSETVLHLLLGFDEAERRQPATYQLLIEGLAHPKPLVRELSYWHLVRLAPTGKGIPYNPAGAPEQIDAGVRQWRELIPAGQLPGAPKSELKK